MKTYPDIDQEFKYASPFVKNALAHYGVGWYNGVALDIPCGNGRNTFLLAGHFKKVLGIDICKPYLEAIKRNESQYPNESTIETLQLDILSYQIEDVGAYDLICNVHFYDAGLIKTVLTSIKKGGYLLVETPGCHGNNFKDLPNEREIAALFNNCDIVLKEFNACKNDKNTEQRGSLKILVKC